MKLNKIVLALGMGMTFISGAAMAIGDPPATTTDNTHVYFTGEITNTPCSMTNDSLDQTVPFGHISANALADGGTSSEADFKFVLEDCPAGNNTISVKFDGTTDEGQTDLITLGSPDATGAGIQILADGKALKLGEYSAKKTLTEGRNELNYAAQVKGYSTSIPITTGAFKAVSNVTFTYN
jgi:type 1 fimbria pilin